MITMLCVIITVVLVVCTCSSFDNDEPGVGAFFLILALCAGWTSYERITRPDPPLTPEQAAIQQKEEAKRISAIERARIPKILSKSDDGCTVYKFADSGYNHYFTRCEKSVETEAKRKVGKSSKTESISTIQE